MSTQYPAVVRLWENARSEFVAFLDYAVKVGIHRQSDSPQ